MPKVIGIEDGSVSSDFAIEKKDKIYIPRKKWEIRYYVLADNHLQTEDQIYGTSGLPQLWQVSNKAVCQSVKIAEKSTVFRHPVTGVKTVLWTVVASFDSNIDITQDQPPEAKTPTVRWTGETDEEVLDKDPITGEPIQTKAEEPIILTTQVTYPILEITRYEFYPFSPDVILDYVDHTNSTTFWGAPPGSALMLPMEVDEETIDQVKYVRVTYRIKFKIKKEGGVMLEDTWKARVLHHGFKRRLKAGGEPEVFTDKFGNPATVNLDSDGVKLPAGSPPQYLKFNRFPKVNFNNLGLGPF